jgi:hypothetical protein
MEKGGLFVQHLLSYLFQGDWLPAMLAILSLLSVGNFLEEV